MEEKIYQNAVNCIKVTHRMFVVSLTLVLFQVGLDLSTEAGTSPTTGNVAIPVINLHVDRYTGRLTPLLIISGCVIGAIIALSKLKSSRGDLNGEYQKLIGLYPSFLNTSRWVRAAVAVGLFGLLMMSPVIFLGDGAPGRMGALFSTVFLALLFAMSKLILFWDK